ncbi:anthranilate phosphoribosyltransferase [uncultured Mailhella sp.]|uniref:anthranilate phosphoribosyltransferase n=1 Tax=uncultured Mailhella sp. TaxID=1981031 RepID=UPI0026365EEE|nr:anthranilate phosphoribosyltransferase [uncultured Mailhella sp.]
MFLLIDNYDSFTYNLAQAFCKLGHQPLVVKNDDPGLLALANDPSLRMVCISPGPGHPSRAGYCLDFLKQLSPKIPVLGVCLGHQVLGLYAGSEVVVGPVIMHGKTSEIVHDGKGIYRGVPNPITVGRYHSLVVQIDDKHPNPLIQVTARGPQGEVMSMRFRDRPWVGVQFHPESILTPDGLRLLRNFPDALINAPHAAPTISQVLESVAQGSDLTDEQAEVAFGSMLDGSMTPAQAGALLMGLRMKGEKASELAAAIRIMLARAVKVEGVPEKCIDIVGTGGDGKHSFNCSTSAALTLAGLGYRVLKHGNRAVSSTSGAADAVEGLGLPLEKDPAAIIAMLKKRNFAFQFAPYFHPAFANVGPVRKQLGMRTLFNMLGPMINPGCPDHLMMGVPRPEMVDLVADTLLLRPIRHVAVFCGAGGYDELTTMGRTRIVEIRDKVKRDLIFNPADYGFEPCRPEDVEVHDREEASGVLKELLAGRGPKPMQDMMIVNAAFAIYMLEDNKSLADCVEIARKAVAEGVAQKVLG